VNCNHPLTMYLFYSCLCCRNIYDVVFSICADFCYLCLFRTIKKGESPSAMNNFFVQITWHDLYFYQFLSLSFQWVVRVVVMGGTSWAAYASGAHELTADFCGVRVARSLVFCVVFCWSLFVLCPVSFWSLNCISFFDSRDSDCPFGTFSLSSYYQQ
jgi:hypothetical protein